MNFPECSHLALRTEGRVLYVTLNQPKVRNAMSLAMVREISQVFHAIKDRSREIGIVVLRGAEGYFCAGADLKDMTEARSQIGKSEGDPFFRLNRAFGTMMIAVNDAPQTVVAVLEGAALGGGFGLACVSDVAIAHKDCVFGLPETGLGVIPAQIAPFVVARIGLPQARRLALTGVRFHGDEAVALGIAHFVCPSADAVSERLEATLKDIKRCAPEANRVTKALLLRVGLDPLPELLDHAAQDFSRAVQGEEAKEGMQAFLAKRAPAWSEQG